MGSPEENLLRAIFSGEGKRVKKTNPTCALCEDTVEPAYTFVVEGRDLCQQHGRGILILNGLYERLSNRETEPSDTDFVPELNLAFEMEDWRARKYFAVAQRIIVTSAFRFSGGDFPREELAWKQVNEEEDSDIFQLLSRAGIAELDKGEVRLSSKVKDLCQALVTGERLNSDEVRKTLEGVYGWNSVSLGKALIDDWLDGNRGKGSKGRPRYLCAILSFLGNILYLQEHSEQLDRHVHAGILSNYNRKALPGMSLHQYWELIIRLLGLGGKACRIIEASYSKLTPTGPELEVDLKDTTLLFLERERERQREYIRERGR